jgi:hypothetical protein
MKKKYPNFGCLDQLKKSTQGLMKMEEQQYENFYQLFSTAFPQHKILRDYR